MDGFLLWIIIYRCCISEDRLCLERCIPTRPPACSMLVDCKWGGAWGQGRVGLHIERERVCAGTRANLISP